MTRVQFIVTRLGERLAVLNEQDYEALLDAADALHAGEVMAAVARGEHETLSSDEVDAFLDAATPLAFWRGWRRASARAIRRCS